MIVFVEQVVVDVPVVVVVEYCAVSSSVSPKWSFFAKNMVLLLSTYSYELYKTPVLFSPNATPLQLLL